MKRFMNKKVATIGLTAGLVLGAAGGAFAYFSSTGTGVGTGTVGVSAGLDISQTNTVSGILPDSATHEIDYTVTNNNSGSESVHQVTVTVASITGAGTASGTDALGNPIDACTPSLFTVVQGSPLNANLAGGATASGTATVALADDSNNQDNCQGATLHFAFASN
jgi:hypothetical protein